jgi:outer membrane murein-binding lipoprotein Lpp
MIFKRRAGLLLAGTVIGACCLTGTAFADDAQTQQLQNQINALQQELQALQNQVKQTKKEANAAEQAVQNLPGGLYNAAPPGSAPMVTKGPPAWFSGIHISLAGSFLAMEGVWRQHNEVASGASDTPFSSMPFPNSPLFHENELAFSAAQSRVALKANGDIDPVQHLTGYYEMDWLGAGTSANNRESNSYNLRVRQLWSEYDNDYYHFHISGGQQWSFLTQDRVGELPLHENVPLTIDAQYVAGFNWARQPSFRFVEDWNKVAWFGVSVEAPQTNFQSNSVGVIGGPQQGETSQGVTGATNVGGSTVPPGLSINDINACQPSGLLNATTGCSVNNFPDIIEKFAVDPGFGHYELLGLQRFFTDRVYTTAVEGSGSNKTTTGWGIGGNALVPAWPKIIDLQGSVLWGAGTGRYGSSQLPDVVIGSNGSLTPLTTLQFLVGAVIHPVSPLDIYVYYGEEDIQSNVWNIGTSHGGYGNPLAVNTGCLLENQASGPAGFNDPIAGTSCSAASNIQRVQEITVGFWYSLYQGDFGRLRYGMQYEFFQLTAFPGAGGPITPTSTPNQGINPFNQAVFFSFRYYPFN